MNRVEALRLPHAVPGAPGTMVCPSHGRVVQRDGVIAIPQASRSDVKHDDADVRMFDWVLRVLRGQRPRAALRNPPRTWYPEGWPFVERLEGAVGPDGPDTIYVTRCSPGGCRVRVTPIEITQSP